MQGLVLGHFFNVVTSNGCWVNRYKNKDHLYSFRNLGRGGGTSLEKFQRIIFKEKMYKMKYFCFSYQADRKTQLIQF